VPREVVLRLPPSPEPPATGGRALVGLAATALGVPPATIAEARLRRLSFDARRRERRWRLVVDVWLAGEPLPAPIVTEPPAIVPPGPRAPRVVIVGSGPAGLFCALDCLAAGLHVTVLERGRDVRTRRRAIALVSRGLGVDPDSNYCFGEGGAGTYSDGKLYTRAGSKADVRGVLETLVAHGAPPEILASWRPHVGSNRLPGVVRALRESILRAGGAVRFGTRAEEIETAAVAGGRRVIAVVARALDDGTRERIACDALVLAAGHSALDAVRMAAAAGATLAPKGFAMGLRIEHAQAWLDARQYGGLRDACDLPASFYELASSVDARGVYSFCMCPGGFIVPATTDAARTVVNGMSLARRDSPFANAGVVVQIEPEDWCGEAGERWGWRALLAAAVASVPAVFAGLPHPTCVVLPARADDDPLFGVRLQLALEGLAARAGGGAGRAPAQRTDLFVAGAGRAEAPSASSYRPGLGPADLGGLLPAGMADRLRRALGDFDRRLPGFAGAGGQLIGVETRTSSPVRLVRDPETLACPAVAGLHPCGEGAGHAGGIVSAALDGRRVARALAARLVG
jgi:uncharacterized FAD-dependent dehydrogenase